MFNNKSKAAEEIVESIVWTVSGCVCKRKEFASISLEDLNRCWTAVLKGAWHTKTVQLFDMDSPSYRTPQVEF